MDGVVDFNQNQDGRVALLCTGKAENRQKLTQYFFSKENTFDSETKPLRKRSPIFSQSWHPRRRTDGRTGLSDFQSEFLGKPDDGGDDG